MRTLEVTYVPAIPLCKNCAASTESVIAQFCSQNMRRRYELRMTTLRLMGFVVTGVLRFKTREGNMKTKALFWRVVLMVIAVGIAGVASAQNVHLKPPNAKPSFVDNGLTLTAFGALAGLGGGDVLVNLSAQASVTSTCTNPSGGTQPPGQNPAPITVTGGQAIPEEELKNGTTPFRVTTTAPVTPIPGAPDCPNPRWTESITDLAFTSATITVEQPVGNVVLTVSCTFLSPTTNGGVAGSNVVCTKS
jgi:hypothetical protein